MIPSGLECHWIHPCPLCRTMWEGKESEESLIFYIVHILKDLCRVMRLDLLRRRLSERQSSSNKISSCTKIKYYPSSNLKHQHRGKLRDISSLTQPPVLLLSSSQVSASRRTERHSCSWPDLESRYRLRTFSSPETVISLSHPDQVLQDDQELTLEASRHSWLVRTESPESAQHL